MKQVKARGLHFVVREGTTDEKVVDEVVQRRCYFRRGFCFVEPGERWLDLGANIGTFSILACAHGAEVTAFEPEPENCELLRLNLSLNGFTANVHQAAVIEGCSKRRLLYLCKGDKNKYRHTLIKRRGRETLSVPTVGIDELIGQVDCIKMDIEGSELPMLSSSKSWEGIKKLVFEYHFDFDRLVANFRERMEGLRQCGFQIHHAKIPPNLIEYNYFPAAKIVFCRK